MGTYSLNIPGWEQTQLLDLYNAGDLGKLNPLYLGLIDSAESSGQGSTFLNSSGYGGFFGLSTGKYATSGIPNDPGSVPLTTLTSTDPASFDQQAVVAAGFFQSLMNEFGGNPVRAEAAYQNGPGGSASSPGATLFAQALGGNTPPQLTAGGVTGAPASGATTNVNTITLSGVGGALQALNKVLNPTPAGNSILGSLLGPLTGVATDAQNIAVNVEGLIVRGLFAIAFVGVFYFGLKYLGSGSGGSRGGGYNLDKAIDDIQSQSQLGQSQQRIELQQRGQGQTQQRIQQAALRTQQAGQIEGQRSRERKERFDYRREQDTAASTLNAQHAKGQGKHAKKNPSMASTLKDVLETVGGEAAL